MSTMEKISIVVPVYNPAGEELRRCVYSLLKQTHEAIELILVDDGSNIATAAACDDFACGDSRVCVVHQANGGVGAARNRGIELASGPYLAFVDADDCVEPGFAEALYQAIKGCELAICGLDRADAPLREGALDIGAFYADPAAYAQLPYINYVWNKLYSLSLIREHHICFDPCVKLGEDALFVAEYLSHCRRISCVSEQLYHYSQSGDSAVHRFQPQFWLWEQRVIHAQWKMFTAVPLAAEQHDALLQWLYGKFRYVVFYYGGKGESSRRILREVCRDSLFQMLVCLPAERKGRVFSRNARMQLWLWRRFAATGMMVGYEWTRLRRGPDEKKA